MIKYIIRRILMLIPVILGVITVVFTINYFNTSSPAITILGASATPETIAQVEAELGLDRPYLVQLGSYLWNIVSKFDFGTSYIYKTSCMSMILSRLPVTMFIGVMGVLLSVIIGIPLGILAAWKQNSALDYSATFCSTILSALPNFWVALMLVLFFSVNLKLLPVSGVSSWKGYVLPIVAGALPSLAMFTRMTRSSVLEVIRQDYVRTARAKGLAERKVISHHVIRNGLIPVATVVGMITALCMTGSMISERIFNIPGLGLLLYNAIVQNDYIMVQSGAIVTAVIICVMNLITDIAYAFIDPRIKSKYTAGSKKQGKKQRPAAGSEAAI